MDESPGSLPLKKRRLPNADFCTVPTLSKPDSPLYRSGVFMTSEIPILQARCDPPDWRCAEPVQGPLRHRASVPLPQAAGVEPSNQERPAIQTMPESILTTPRYYEHKW